MILFDIRPFCPYLLIGIVGKSNLGDVVRLF